VTIISTGVQTARVIQAAEILGAAGIEALVLHVPTLKPLDQKVIVDAAMATGLVVTVEEHTEVGGLGGAVTETLCDAQPLPVRRIGLGEALGESGPNEALLEKYGLSASRAAGVVLEFLHQKRAL
jgi:transketolase